MGEIFHELHEDVLQTEIDHHKNEIEAEKELIEEHQDQIDQDTAGLAKKIHEAEIEHDEHRLEKAEQELQKEQRTLDEAEGRPVGNEEACAKAEEFKKLADQVKEERIIDEDLFETPIQPLK